MAAMGTLTLVRHGQASFGAADYDKLSERGWAQCRHLGEHLAAHGQRFDLVLTGTLRRHRESLAGIVDGMGDSGACPQAQVLPGLDEYQPEALIRAVHPEPLTAATDPEAVRHHFRLLRQGLLAWMEGRTRPEGMPDFEAFSAGVRDALAQARTRHDGQVLIVSSGGPISVAIGQVLGLAPPAVVELNLRLRNSALTEFAASSQRHALLSFNHLPHLATPERAPWITYA
jgi:broad specificity phosphatase PhoE